MNTPRNQKVFGKKETAPMPLGESSILGKLYQEDQTIKQQQLTTNESSISENSCPTESLIQADLPSEIMVEESCCVNES